MAQWRIEWSGLLLTAAILITPIAIVLFAGHPVFTYAHEFVAYRIGDALALLNGEGGYVRPVQGLPNALLSKVIVWGLSLLGWEPTYASFQTYAVAFFAITVTGFCTVIALAWCSGISLEQKIAVAAFVIFPLYIGGQSTALYLAPDYWIFEHLWLSGSLLVLFSRPNSGLWLGAWCGLGASIKIPLALIGFALIVTCGAPILWALAGGAIAYVGVNVLYGGFWAPFMLWNQATFFLHPNHSATYADWRTALSANPAILALTATALIAVVTSRRWLWLIPLAAYAYLVFKRPHDTSIASASFAAAFIALAFLRARYAVPAMLAVGFLTGFSPVAWWLNASPHWDTTEAERLSEKRGVWLMNQNEWNALLLPQAIGYNGGLGLRAPHDQPKIFQKLFPESWIFDTSQLSEAIEKAGTTLPIYWTEPPGASQLAGRIQRHGFKVESVPFSFMSRNWRFYTARADCHDIE